MTSLEASNLIQRLMLFGLIALSAMLMGALLARDLFGLVFLFGFAVWLLVLPYHATLATNIAVATFSAALIVPFPGRPFWWEIGTLMGWTGLLLTIALRRYSNDSNPMLRRHALLLIGMMIYCATLFFVMKVRGVGFRALGGNQLGGRLYVQQLLCAVFPLLFIARPPSEKNMVLLYALQCVLASTFLVSDFVFSYGGTGMFGLLYFFELPNDGFNFEHQSMNLGIRRFQSLYSVSHGFLMLLLLFRSLSDFTRLRTAWTWLVLIGLLAVGTLAGHRYLVIVLTLQLPIWAYAQRFVNFQRGLIAGLVGLILVVLTYVFAQDLPMAAQRTVSLLPGIEVSRVAQDDGDVTWQGRKELRRIGWELAPQYYLKGRGFAKNDLQGGAQATALAILNPDTFYNGFIGLLVSTGIPGTVGMCLFLLAGNLLAFRVIRILRTVEIDDNFLRLCVLQSAQFIASTIIFLGFHGDAEFALRTFGLPAAMLVACERHLRLRYGLDRRTERWTQANRSRENTDTSFGGSPAPAGAPAA